MPPRPFRSQKQTLPPTVVLVLSLLVTLLATYQVSQSVNAKERERFENSVQVARDDIQDRMNTYINALWGTAALFAASEHVTLEDFRAYVQALEIRSRYSGAQGIGFALRFPPSQERLVEQQQRKTRPNFDVHPNGPRPEMTSIIWLEPEAGRNLRAIGYDMFSNPVRRAAMEQARDSGEAAVSGKVILVQETDTDRQNGFLIYTPVYRGGVDPGTVEARRAALVGYVYSPFRATDLFRRIFGSQQHPRLDMEIYDGPRPEEATLLYRSDTRPPRYRPRFRETHRLDVAGRSWTLVFATRPGFDLASQTGMVTLVAAGGLLISFLLFAIVLGQTRGKASAERLAAELRDSEEALRAANQAKDEFMAMLGHELRNPLAAVNNSLALLKLRIGHDPGARQALQTAERQLRHQTRLVEDLLDVSRVTSGKIALRKERLDLAEIVRHAAEAQRARAEEREHRLTVQVDSQPLWIEGDPVRLEQILVNLITNAIKYTPPGGEIEVSVSREGPEGAIRVRDTGKGIPAEMLEQIFDLFAQGPTTTARSEGGLGLGLTLVRALVRLHGGEVVAVSEGPGRGSEFTVRLPLSAASEAPAPAEAPLPAPSGNGKARRVVIVEDNPDARETLQELLEVWGHEVRAAEEGGTGLELILDTAPEVAIVDIGLPVLDGYEVARRVRAAGVETHLVALTGYGQPEDRQRSAEAGFDKHLVKPVDLEQLEKALRGA